jgi:hypothetical protein
MAKQTAPSSMANQYRDEMKYGFWYVSDINENC